jgi:hypothetical protein
MDKLQYKFNLEAPCTIYWDDKSMSFENFEWFQEITFDFMPAAGMTIVFDRLQTFRIEEVLVRIVEDNYKSHALKNGDVRNSLIVKNEIIFPSWFKRVQDLHPSIKPTEKRPSTVIDIYDENGFLCKNIDHFSYAGSMSESYDLVKHVGPILDEWWQWTADKYSATGNNLK